MSSDSSTLPPLRIAALSGSLQSKSGNRALLEVASSVAKANVTVMIFDGLRAIPAFDPEDEAGAASTAVQALREAVASSDALLLASPEYGFSLPGVLKNAIDWLIGSGELEGKVVAITAAVSSAGRGRRGLEALADTLRALSVRIVGGSAIVRGPNFERDVAALLDAIEGEVHAPRPAPAHGFGMLRPSALASEWIAAFNRADADSLAALYREDATSYLRNAQANGRAAIREALKASLGSSPPERLVENLFEDGDVAILEWKDVSCARGCSLFRVKRGEIELDRHY